MVDCLYENHKRPRQQQLHFLFYMLYFFVTILDEHEEAPTALQCLSELRCDFKSATPLYETDVCSWLINQAFCLPFIFSFQKARMFCLHLVSNFTFSLSHFDNKNLQSLIFSTEKFLLQKHCG